MSPRPGLRSLGLSLAVLLTASTGCAGGHGMDAQRVLQHDQCQGLEKGLTRVDYQGLAGIRGSRLLSMTQPQGDTPEGDPPKGGPLLIAISRGRQPTPGYALELDGARLEDDTAIIDVTWREPEPDAVLAQVMTHPCLVVGLAEGGYSRVEARLGSGEVIGALALP